MALVYYVKVTVNKKVEEELPKAIENNPTILYFKGEAKNIQTYSDDNNICYSESYIDIDCTKIGITTLEFPTELNLFYAEQGNIKYEGNGFKECQQQITIKTPVVEYDAFIDNNTIKFRYKEPKPSESVYTSRVIWVLKVPNPIYKR